MYAFFNKFSANLKRSFIVVRVVGVAKILKRNKLWNAHKKRLAENVDERLDIYVARSPSDSMTVAPPMTPLTVL